MNKTILVLVIAAAFVAGTITTTSIVTAETETIIACVHTGQGKDLRIVDSADECKNNEIPLEWNIQGIPSEKGDTGDQGEKGDTGDQGEKGDTGVLTTYARNGPSTNVPPNTIAVSSAKCDTGDIATGGGASHGIDEQFVNSSPTFTGNTPTGWETKAFNPTNKINLFIAATVICADVTP